MAYNTETTNVQFLNQAFLDKIDQGMEKEASVAMTTFVRQYLREDGFARRILPPNMITAADLDRQLTEEPVIIVEKEPDSIAASMPFLGRSEIRYFKGARYPVTFEKIATPVFTKSKFELATYRTDIRTVLQENSLKDLQRVEDLGFYTNALAIATAAGNVHTISGGATIPNILTAGGYMVRNKLPIGSMLMTQSMYLTLMGQPATQVGSPVASEQLRGERALDVFYGWKIITTNKNDILPDNQIMFFAPPEYLGQFYALQDATVFLKTEADMLQFMTYEAIGMGFGNTNGVVVANF